MSLRIRKHFVSKAFSIGFILALLIVLFPLQKEINGLRIKENLSETLVIMPGDFINFFIIGGFRGVAADVLWLRADKYWYHGEWYKILPIYRTIAWLQPHFIEVWSLGSWHMAYNLYAYSKDDLQKQQFLQMGIDFLKEGIIKNRDKYILYFELGWTYFHKAESYDEAIRFLKKAVQFDSAPTYIDRLIAHAYRNKGDFAGEAAAWKTALVVHPEDEYHIELCRQFLEKCKRRIGTPVSGALETGTL